MKQLILQTGQIRQITQTTPNKGSRNKKKCLKYLKCFIVKLLIMNSISRDKEKRQTICLITLTSWEHLKELSDGLSMEMLCDKSLNVSLNELLYHFVSQIDFKDFPKLCFKVINLWSWLIFSQYTQEINQIQLWLIKLLTIPWQKNFHKKHSRTSIRVFNPQLFLLPANSSVSCDNKLVKNLFIIWKKSLNERLLISNGGH